MFILEMYKEIFIETKKREEFIDITDLIKKEINCESGILNVFVPHSTSAVTINENADLNLPLDISNFLNQLVPKGKYIHDKIDNNGDAHIKTSLIGNSILIPIKNKKLCLGEWQDIFLCEFDGPRKRKVILNTIS